LHPEVIISMGQKKLIRFSELETFPNVLQYPENTRGNWHTLFPGKGPITLELACGKGEYALGMGRLYPDRNFLGVDVKGNRIWVGAKTALKEGLSNVFFLRTQIDRISTYFEKGEVKDIWLTFPDPHLRISRSKKRLTHPNFLRKYQQFLGSDSYIHLKTDSPVLYAFTLDVITQYELELNYHTDDLYALPANDPVLQIQTHYEKLDISGSKKIHYVRFRLPEKTLPDKDKQLNERTRERETERGD
jgi:tRNA (guanine-N7-)-methyltransferase